MSYALFSNNTESIIINGKLGVFNAYRLKKLNHNGYKYDFSDSIYYYVPAINGFATQNVGQKAKVLNRAKKTFTYNLNVRSKIDERTYVKKVNAFGSEMLECARKQILG
jgi:hypothetical protein